MRRGFPAGAHRGMGLGGELVLSSSSEEEEGRDGNNRPPLRVMGIMDESLPDEPQSPSSEGEEVIEIIDTDVVGGGALSSSPDLPAPTPIRRLVDPGPSLEEAPEPPRRRVSTLVPTAVTVLTIEQVVAARRIASRSDLSRNDAQRKKDRKLKAIHHYFEPTNQALVEYCDALGFYLEYEGTYVRFGYNFWDNPTKSGPMRTFQFFEEDVFNTGTREGDTDRWVFQVKRIIVFINKARNLSQSSYTYDTYEAISLDDTETLSRARDQIYAQVSGMGLKGRDMRQRVVMFWNSLSHLTYMYQADPSVDVYTDTDTDTDAGTDIGHPLSWWSQAFLYGLNIILDADQKTVGPLIRRISLVFEFVNPDDPLNSPAKEAEVEDMNTSIVGIVSPQGYDTFIQSQVDRFGSLFMISKDPPRDFLEYKEARHGALIVLFMPYIPKRPKKGIVSLLPLLRKGHIHPAAVTYLRRMWKRTYIAMSKELDEYDNDGIDFIVARMVTLYQEKFSEVGITEPRDRNKYLDACAAAALRTLDIDATEEDRDSKEKHKSVVYMMKHRALVKFPGFSWACAIFFLWAEYSCYTYGDMEGHPSLWDSPDYNPEQVLQDLFEEAWREEVRRRQERGSVEESRSPSPPSSPRPQPTPIYVDLVSSPSPERPPPSPEDAVTPHTPMKSKKDSTKKKKKRESKKGQKRKRKHVPSPDHVVMRSPDQSPEKVVEVEEVEVEEEGGEPALEPSQALPVVSLAWVSSPLPSEARNAVPTAAVFIPAAPLSPQDTVPETPRSLPLPIPEEEPIRGIPQEEEDWGQGEDASEGPEDYMNPDKPFKRFAGVTNIVRTTVVLRLHQSIEPALREAAIEAQRKGVSPWFKELISPDSQVALETYCVGLGYDLYFNEAGLFKLSFVYWVGKGRIGRLPNDRKLATVMEKHLDRGHSKFRRLYAYQVKRVIALINKGINIVRDNPEGGRHYEPRYVFPKEAMQERADCATEVYSYVTEKLEGRTPLLKAATFVGMLRNMPYECGVEPPIDTKTHDYPWWQQAFQYGLNVALDDDPTTLSPAIRMIYDYSEIARTDRLDHTAATAPGPYLIYEAMVISQTTFQTVMQGLCDLFDIRLRILSDPVSEIDHPHFRTRRHNALLVLFTPLSPEINNKAWASGGASSLLGVLRMGKISPGHAARVMRAWVVLYDGVAKRLRDDPEAARHIMPKLIRYYKVLMSQIPRPDPDQTREDLNNNAIFALSTMEPLTKDVLGRGLVMISEPSLPDTQGFSWACASFILYCEATHYNRYKADLSDGEYRGDFWSIVEFDMEARLEEIWTGSETVVSPVEGDDYDGGNVGGGDDDDQDTRDVMDALEEAEAEAGAESRRGDDKGKGEKPSRKKKQRKMRALVSPEEEAEEEAAAEKSRPDKEEEGNVPVNIPEDIPDVPAEAVVDYYTANKAKLTVMGLESWDAVLESTGEYTNQGRLKFLEALLED